MVPVAIEHIINSLICPNEQTSSSQAYTWGHIRAPASVLPCDYFREIFASFNLPFLTCFLNVSMPVAENQR